MKPRNTLTHQEKIVASMIATGDRSGEIAKDLGISEATVKRHLLNICDKTGMENRTQIAIWWIRREHAIETADLRDRIAALEYEREKLIQQRDNWKALAY